MHLVSMEKGKFLALSSTSTIFWPTNQLKTQELTVGGLRIKRPPHAPHAPAYPKNVSEMTDLLVRDVCEQFFIHINEKKISYGCALLIELKVDPLRETSIFIDWDVSKNKFW